jgi:hypothetical protein
MNIHKNARLTPRGRERIVRQIKSGRLRWSRLSEQIFRVDKWSLYRV